MADLADVYADASPDLWDGLENAVTTARTFNAHSGDIDAALMAALGFAEHRRRQPRTRRRPTWCAAPPTWCRRPSCSTTTARMIFCTIRNYRDVAAAGRATALGGNGYSLARRRARSLGAGNPFVYPDNLPRVNAHGGPEGRPGCWQKITRDLWPCAVSGDGHRHSLAPYNHVELGQPMLIDYVWGRQVGEHTINP